jgi:hypothetical protein
MYLIEIVLINHNNNIFFDEETQYTESQKQELELLFNKWQEPVRHSIYKHKLEAIHFPPVQRSDGSWVKVTRLGHFISISALQKYWDAFYADFEPWSRGEINSVLDIKKNWQTERKITTEANIIHADGGFISTIHSCHQKICGREGGCTDENACHSIPQEKLYKSYRIPLSSISRDVKV